jgi:hypothetical protein
VVGDIPVGQALMAKRKSKTAKQVQDIRDIVGRLRDAMAEAAAKWLLQNRAHSTTPLATEYKGPLAEPMRLGGLVALGEDPERPPLWATQQCAEAGLSSQQCQEIWKLLIESEQESASAQYRRNVDLLFQHYEIDRMGTAPLTMADVLLGRADAVATCGNMADAAAWQQLALVLAERHVPAFQIDHALQDASKSRAKKQHYLGVWHTLCLFFHLPLHENQKKQPLCSELEALATVLIEQVQSTGVKERTIRELRKQMREAHSAYQKGCASDFQRQFVEDVFPRLARDFEQLGANGVARDP